MTYAGEGRAEPGPGAAPPETPGPDAPSPDAPSPHAPSPHAPGPDGPRGDAGEESTGDPRVDAAVARLAEVDGLPTSQHAEVYDEIHRRLQDALADLDGS